MAVPNCPRCNSTAFEINYIIPLESKHKLAAVNCKSCGAVISAMDFYNIGSRLNAQDTALKEIAARLGISVKLGE